MVGTVLLPHDLSVKWVSVAFRSPSLMDRINPRIMALIRTVTLESKESKVCSLIQWLRSTVDLQLQDFPWSGGCSKDWFRINHWPQNLHVLLIIKSSFGVSSCVSFSIIDPSCSFSGVLIIWSIGIASRSCTFDASVSPSDHGLSAY